MNEANKKEILKKAKIFFREIIAVNHSKSLRKCKKLSNFSYNPFLIKYLSNFAFNNTNPENLAKVLIYPHILGTSINTIFGTNLQKFIGNILEGFGSAIPGIDIEFIDQIDKRKKYCQLKAGPTTINKDDVVTIKNHFSAVRNKGRIDNYSIGIDDLIVGVLYGTPEELNGNYKAINNTHPVLVGKDFWTKLTGDDTFYADLIKTFGEIADETNGKKLLTEVVRALASDIEDKHKQGDL